MMITAATQTRFHPSHSLIPSRDPRGQRLILPRFTDEEPARVVDPSTQPTPAHRPPLQIKFYWNTAARVSAFSLWFLPCS